MGRCLWSTGAIIELRRNRRRFYRLTEIGQQALDAARHPTVPLDLARPSPLPRIVGKFQLQLTPLAQSRNVDRRRHEARAAQVQIALARALRRQSQTMAELQFGLEKVAP